ncbi:SusD/RagB family nutrient-binding outer membrane lipoprotein [Pedobacter sp. AW31-3R]|uniref:SusD/RagB family nutrient-binding outer membrane lipoprotein n=1 Tax=Pedobacter sp. AW31-3R TaxID=3445781 RepID=UPI003FA0040F
MKNYIIKAGLFVALAASFSSCKKGIDERFLNPEKSTTKSIPGFFTAMLNNDRVAAKYWNVRTFLSLMPGTYAQTSFFANSNGAYQQSDDYGQQYWNDFYAPGGNGSGPMAQYRTMETVYNTSDEAEKATKTIFMQAAKVVLIEQAAKMVDLWGDIPYYEAGSLVTQSTIVYPKYDEQKTLYTQFIADLDAANTYFKTAVTTAEFSKYDILLSGSVSKWQRYANSLRLRLLMRISNVEESTARTAILAMLNDPTNYPLVDGAGVAAYGPKATDILLSPLTNNTSTLIDAFREGSWYATDVMLNDVMIPANDPRIPVFYDKNSKTVNGKLVQNAEFKAMPYDFTTTEQENNYNNYAVVDSATYFQNLNLPGIVITSSEVNFLKAEAFERWGSTADAKTAYDLALRQSVTFYYYLNNLNASGVKTETLPAASVIDDFVNSSTASYPASGTTAKLAAIYTQKWLNYGILQSTEAWSEYRRTGYPVLQFVTTGKLSGFDVPPNRLVYPAGERNYNGANYAAVQGKDTRLTKIFWDVN